MKQKIKKAGCVILACLLFSNILCGCEKKNEHQFDATIIEVQEEFIMVEAFPGEVVAGEVQVWTGNLDKKVISTLEEGMTVRITNDGKMTMSLPPQMTAVEMEIL